MLKTLKDNSVDSLVTDPPAGIAFMGKEWDTDKGGRKEWIAWMESVMRECLRVMKPGAHGLVWALPRTAHWTATALEDAGCEIRDCITHLFGSGFPKSLDISKAIDKAAGACRAVVGVRDVGPDIRGNASNGRGISGSNNSRMVADITIPATDGAKQWQGFGTALKPAAEFWWLVRKPISEKTVAANVLKWGTGGLNIDGCRVKYQSSDRLRHNEPSAKKAYSNDNRIAKMTEAAKIIGTDSGRFPANLVFSHSPYCTDEICDIECAILQLDAQSGPCKTGKLEPHHKLRASTNRSMSGPNQERSPRQSFGGDSGGASRFFYCAKVSTSERNAGLEGMPDRDGALCTGATRPNRPARLGDDPHADTAPKKNHHPTVKPRKLMRYLCKLVTPPGGVVLDPFMGSGSTGLAAKSEGFGFIGIERETEYFDIAKARLKE